MTVLFLQMRAHQAGAQASLHRLLASGALSGQRVAVVCGREGWLTEATRALGIEVHVLAFPRSRSLAGRLARNRAFARRVARRVPDLGLVVANDHGEGLLARAVARVSGARWVAILRSSETTPRDLAKYAIRDAAAVYAVGGHLQARAAGLLGDYVDAYPEGLLEADFVEPAPAPGEVPDAALVVGTPRADKGWADLQAALTAEITRPTRWCFTTDALPFAAPPGHTFEAIGRVDDLAARARDFGLMVHPSRGESFGLAVAEAVAAGVPVLASETGVVPELGLPPGLTFPVGDVPALRARLRALPSAWPPDLAAARRALRENHRLPGRARGFCETLAQLSRPPEPGAE